MKYYLPAMILLVCCVFSCKSFDKDLLINKVAINKDIKPMRVIVRKMEWEMGGQWCWFSMFSLGILNLLGMPANSQTVTVHLSAAIMNSNGKVLKEYEVTGTDTEYNALYYGFGSDDSFNTTVFKAVIDGCKEIRLQLEKDVSNINMLEFHLKRVY